MTYGALNTVTTADVEAAREANSDVGNVGLLTWDVNHLLLSENTVNFAV